MARDENPSGFPRQEEFNRRVEGLLTLWERIYANNGLTRTSEATDRHIAEWQVARRMGIRL